MLGWSLLPCKCRNAYELSCWFDGMGDRLMCDRINSQGKEDCDVN